MNVPLGGEGVKATLITEKSWESKIFHYSRKALLHLVKKAIIYEKRVEFMRIFNYRKLKNVKWDSEIISYIAKNYQE